MFLDWTGVVALLALDGSVAIKVTKVKSTSSLVRRRGIGCFLRQFIGDGKARRLRKREAGTWSFRDHMVFKKVFLAHTLAIVLCLQFFFK